MAKFGPFLVERRDNMLQATYALGQVRLKAGKWALGSLCRKPVFSNRDVVQSCPRKSHSPNLRCSRAGWGPTAKPLALLSTLLAQTVMETGGFPPGRTDCFQVDFCEMILSHLSVSQKPYTVHLLSLSLHRVVEHNPLNRGTWSQGSISCCTRCSKALLRSISPAGGLQPREFQGIGRFFWTSEAWINPSTTCCSAAFAHAMWVAG